MSKLDIALMCGTVNGSPKVLAETLKEFISTTENNSEVFYQVKAFRRLLPAKSVRYNLLIWKLYKMLYYFRDKKLFRVLRKKDAVIICDWTPNGFYKDTYDIDKARSIIGKPILYYSVQYLENSPDIIKKLKEGGHAHLDRYDWHLAVSSVTAINGKPSPPWNQIGLYLKSTGLTPTIKEKFFAVVDFERKDYESHREIQLKALEELGIPYLSLEGQYEMDEIREIYKKASIFFIQFHEAYGLPIAECLACGSYIATPDSSWPMSWRLNEDCEYHGPGELADCFIVYDGLDDLKMQLEEIRNSYDYEKTPQAVFESYLSNYPSFYKGNKESLLEILERARNRNL